MFPGVWGGLLSASGHFGRCVDFFTAFRAHHVEPAVVLLPAEELLSARVHVLPPESEARLQRVALDRLETTRARLLGRRSGSFAECFEGVSGSILNISRSFEVL